MTTEHPARRAGAAFSSATAIRASDAGAPDAGGPPGSRAWSATIFPGWDISGNANGGYLLAIVARALGATLDRPDPVTITAHSLAPGTPGPVTVHTNVVKQGRRFGTATATLLGGDRPLLSAIGTFGDLDQASGPELVDRAPPAMPEPDDCVPVVATDTFPPPFMGRIALRLHPEDAQFLAGKRSGQARMRGWFNLLDGEPTDALALLCAVDAFPPTAFNTQLPVAWVPTIELTAHLRARPAPGWLRCQFTTHFVTGGFLEEDGEVWDSTDRLVAQSRQLALVPRG
jgi:acyl-CoA thioesterase